MYDIVAYMFKEYSRWQWYFDNQPKFIDETTWLTRTIYCLYENCIELSEKAVEEWWNINHITGSYDLLQVNKWMEYEVQYIFTKDDPNDEIKEMERDRILAWRKGSFIYNQ